MKINKKVIKQKLSFLYATHRHDLFYITVKHHQNIPNGIQVVEQTRKCLQMDIQMMAGCQAHRSIPRTFRSGDKKSHPFTAYFLELCDNSQGIFKVNGYTFKGSNSVIFIFPPISLGVNS